MSIQRICRYDINFNKMIVVDSSLEHVQSVIDLQLNLQYYVCVSFYIAVIVYHYSNHITIVHMGIFYAGHYQSSMYSHLFKMVDDICLFVYLFCFFQQPAQHLLVLEKLTREEETLWSIQTWFLHIICSTCFILPKTDSFHLVANQETYCFMGLHETLNPQLKGKYSASCTNIFTLQSITLERVLYSMQKRFN